MQLISERLPIEHTVSSQQAGMRLDAALASVFPEAGIRARRRLWDWCIVLVNHKSRLPGFVVVEGDSIRMVAKDQNAPAQKDTSFLKKIELLFLDGHFAVLSKPARLHTAYVQGGREASLELLLPQVWESLIAEKNAAALWGKNIPRLLTRLDWPSSGLIAGARTGTAETTFREWEQEGRVRKTYFALVQGALQSPLCLQRSLYVKNRKKTEVACNDTPDKTHWTLVTPLCVLPGKDLCRERHPQCIIETQMPLIDAYIHEVQATAASGEDDLACSDFSLWGNPGQAGGHSFEEEACTLVAVTIFCGARHQIRAHLAWAGFPLVGDILYGAADDCPLFLHHAVQQTPAFTVVSRPSMDVPT